LTESEKIRIDIKTLETPAGQIPTVEAIKDLVKGLNILNEEMVKNRTNINNEVLKMMESVERELKSLKKLLAEETISFSALKESITTIHEKIEKALNEDKKSYQSLENSINELKQSIKMLETNLESKIYSILRKIIKPKT